MDIQTKLPQFVTEFNTELNRIPTVQEPACRQTGATQRC